MPWILNIINRLLHTISEQLRFFEPFIMFFIRICIVRCLESVKFLSNKLKIYTYMYNRECQTFTQSHQSNGLFINNKSGFENKNNMWLKTKVEAV